MAAESNPGSSLPVNLGPTIQLPRVQVTTLPSVQDVSQVPPFEVVIQPPPVFLVLPGSVLAAPRLATTAANTKAAESNYSRSLPLEAEADIQPRPAGLQVQDPGLGDDRVITIPMPSVVVQVLPSGGIIPGAVNTEAVTGKN
ncbi:hypothetical protein BRADI_4g04600v3 [Brachypodium distachyon]|uniref:Uncharacterized protein n=1 Tax=Brachypodium distachyon TaxID=15368 RepID=I1IHH3_BRADI|nr:hypothetical protein BRADI_4g04600v3 [Brachypodium distachyon]